MENKIVDLVQFIASEFCEDKENLSVTTAVEGNKFVITISASDQDMGKIIGKQGRIAKAIRTIVKSASARERQTYVVQIKDIQEKAENKE
ncbi:MAG: KH domain-containing protein [Firmicutes bacterium]|nr:KH domain-containing protein [Bacillota bacterium]